MNDPAILKALEQRALTKASQVLTGIVTGIIADGHLHDMEIQMLSGWLQTNEEVTRSWPGHAISKLVIQIMEDGVISEEERQHLLTELQAFVGNNFSDTGSLSTEVAQLPFDETAPKLTTGMRICFTGAFIFGTRNACERLATQAGLESANSVSKKIQALIVGSHVSPDWANTSYGLKIMKAMQLREQGHTILIVREKDWLAAMN